MQLWDLEVLNIQDKQLFFFLQSKYFTTMYINLASKNLASNEC